MFDGIYTPIVTPFTAREEIDSEKMHHNLDRWGGTDLAGIVVLGSNGEFAFLDMSEKLALVEDVITHFTKEKNVIVGTGSESTKETIELSKAVAELGAMAVLVLPPHYYRAAMNDDVLYKHYMDVGDESPVPVFVYNMPGNTGINLSSSLVAKLSQHPNIVGIKDTSGSIVQLSELVRDTEDNFSVFPGNAGYLFPALAMGARGATVALANILPQDCCRILSLFKDGKMDAAHALQLRILEINSLVTTRFGIPALKAAMDMLGYQGGNPRRPLKPLPEEKRKLVEDALRRHGSLE
jgi:4-hydroxy-2-oxoglutarate aldolase